jgi:hypothetical protein
MEGVQIHKTRNKWHDQRKIGTYMCYPRPGSSMEEFIDALQVFVLELQVRGDQGRNAGSDHLQAATRRVVAAARTLAEVLRRDRVRSANH